MKPLFAENKVFPVNTSGPALNTVNLMAESQGGPPAVVAPVPSAPVQVPPPRITDELIAELGAKDGMGIATVSAKLMASVKGGDAGDFGKGLTQLALLAKGLDPSALKDKGLVGRLFGRARAAKANLVSKYDTVERQMDDLIGSLDAKARLHQQRIGDIEQMYVDNMTYHQALESAQDRARDLLVQAKADFEVAKEVAPQDPFGAQKLADHSRLIDRLEKRVDDLERAQMLSKQMAPQLRQMQEQARSLVQKFGDVKAVTLPAWKNNFGQFLLALEQKEAVRVLSEVDAITEAALRQGADLLRENAAGVAEARQRSVVSIETLEHIQASLLGSIEDVQRIDEEGRARRAAEVPRIAAMEQQLIEAFVPGKR